MPRKKKQRGRPVSKPMPERIDATPEQIAHVVLGFNPTGHEWQYLKDAPAEPVSDEPAEQDDDGRSE